MKTYRAIFSSPLPGKVVKILAGEGEVVEQGQDVFVMESMKMLHNDGVTANYLQIKYLNPFPSRKTEQYIHRAKDTLLIENNKTAQLESLIRENTGISIEKKLLRYDGRPFTPEQIYQKVREVV